MSIIPGAFYFANLANVDRIAEMVLHEFPHNKLFLLQNQDSLLDADRHGNGWDDQSFYSPWREDPRPLMGILHGLFMFVEVADFWANRLRIHGDSIALRRFKTTHGQVELAYDVLKSHGTFTEIGADLLDDLRGRIDSLSALAASIDGDAVPVLYAELHSAHKFQNLSVNEALRRHREQFELRKETQVK